MRSRSRNAPQVGNDLRYDLKISFLEAAFGVEKSIQLDKMESCPACGGTGAKPGSSPDTCPTCRGRGQVMHSQGFFSISTSCPQCHGEGTIIRNPCGTCRGQGKVKSQKTVTVKIPPGVDSGTRLRLSGEGEDGARGGPPGDLYVVLFVEEHETFQRKGDDIICEVPVSFPQVALGSRIEAPTLEGITSLDIPPGTQTGEIFRMRGLGIPHLKGMGRGDQYVQVTVQTPSKLTKRQEELLREFAEQGGDVVSTGKKKFWQRGV